MAITLRPMYLLYSYLEPLGQLCIIGGGTLECDPRPLVLPSFFCPERPCIQYPRFRILKRIKGIASEPEASDTGYLDPLANGTLGPTTAWIRIRHIFITSASEAVSDAATRPYTPKELRLGGVGFQQGQGPWRPSDAKDPSTPPEPRLFWGIGHKHMSYHRQAPSWGLHSGPLPPFPVDAYSSVWPLASIGVPKRGPYKQINTWFLTSRGFWNTLSWALG